LKVAQVGLHVFYRFGRGTAPTTLLAETAPERATQPVYGPLPPAAPTAPSDYRLASAVITEAPANAPVGLGGPLQAGPEPASAPVEAKSQAARPGEPPKAKLTPASTPKTGEAPVRTTVASASE
jgi:hypothetical protein